MSVVVFVLLSVLHLLWACTCQKLRIPLILTLLVLLFRFILSGHFFLVLIRKIFNFNSIPSLQYLQEIEIHITVLIPKQ